MSDSLRKRISQAAQELFLEQGLEGVSMRKVAKMAGVSAPAIYRHYENKDDLLREIIDEGLEILETYLAPALDEPTPLERLNRLADKDDVKAADSARAAWPCLASGKPSSTVACDADDPGMPSRTDENVSEVGMTAIRPIISARPDTGSMPYRKGSTSARPAMPPS